MGDLLDPDLFPRFVCNQCCGAVAGLFDGAGAGLSASAQGCSSVTKRFFGCKDMKILIILVKF